MFTENNNFITPVLIFDKVNGNKRFYSSKNANKIISDFLNYPNKLGQFNDNLPDNYDGSNLIVDIALVSHNIVNIFLNENTLFAEVKILDTPKGVELKNKLINDVSSVVFRTAGISGADNKVDDNGIYIVENYQLLGIHAIPSQKAVELWKSFFSDLFLE